MPLRRRPTRRSAPARLAAALLLGWCAGPATAAPPPPGPTQALIAVTSLNGQGRGEWFVHRSQDGDLLVRREDLDALGLKDAGRFPETDLQGEAHVPLRGLPGLDFEFDERTQALRITAAPQLLPLTTLQGLAPSRRALALAGQGGFLNWAVARDIGTFSGARNLSGTIEAGFYLGRWQVLGSGQADHVAGIGTRWRRLAAQARLDEAPSLRRWTVGDLFPRAPELGGSAALVGLSVGRHEGLEPGLLRYALGHVRGEARLPSEIEVYVDGQRIRTERVGPGPFEIRDILAQQGAREVEVRVRDAFGRLDRHTHTMYTSERLLRPGLHDYELALGRLRTSALDGAQGGAAAFSAWHRWGLAEALTLGLHAQGRQGQANAGASLTLGLGGLGVSSAAVSASRRQDLSGHALLLRHDYLSRRWAAGLMLRRDSPAHADFAALSFLPNRRTEALVYGQVALPWGGALSAQHSWRTAHPASAIALPPGTRLLTLEPRRSVSLGYTTALGSSRSLLRLHLARIHDPRGTRHEASVGLSFALGSAGLFSARAQAGQDGERQTVQLSRGLPVGEGWGYDLSADRLAGQGGGTQARASGQFHGSRLLLRGDVLSTGGDTLAQLSAAGGIAWLDGQWFAGRPVQEGFALVKVGSLPGVPVTVNGQPAGLTDAAGRLLLPRVGSYQEVDIGIDARAMPIDHAVPRLVKRLVLPDRGGRVVDFEVRRIQAVSARLVRPDGSALARSLVHLASQATPLRTGLSGELYSEQLPPGRHEGRAQDSGAECRFTLEVPHSDQVVIELGDLRCDPPGTGS